MVGVAQLVEHLVVVQEVAGSSPVTHPGSGPSISMLGPACFSRFPWSELVSGVVRNGERRARTGVGAVRDRVRVVRDGDSGAS